MSPERISTGIIIITIIVVLSFYGISVWLIIDNIENKKKYVKKDECVKPLGQYQVEHGIKYTDILETILNVPNLTEAINKCNSNKICDRFTYNYTNKIMRIVSLNSSGIRDILHDTYTRQSGITYVNPNNTKKLYTTNYIKQNNYSTSTIPEITTSSSSGSYSGVTSTSTSTSSSSGSYSGSTSTSSSGGGY